MAADGDLLRRAGRLAGLAGSLATLPFLAAARAAHRASGGRLFADLRLAFSRLLVPRQIRQADTGMTSSHERAFFEYFGRDLFTGRGEIVDLGCWLGSTTAALARGLAANRRPAAARRSIHAYDAFVWAEWMDYFRGGDRRLAGFAAGDTFRPEFERRLGAWRDRIVVHEGDVLALGWAGGPIELLLVDVMKSWELATGVFDRFLPAVAPGGWVLQQDFCHFWESWVHPIHYRLRHCLKPAYDIPLSAGFLFRLEGRCADLLPLGGLDASCFDDSEVDAAFTWSESLVRRNHRPAIAAAKVMHFAAAGRHDRAHAELVRCRRAGYSFRSDLGLVERQLAV